MNPIKSYEISASPGCADSLFAANILRDELVRRTGLPFCAVDGGGPIDISICQSRAPAPEGYVLKSCGGVVEIVGYDRLGAIHGAGKFLRECRWGKGFLEIQELDIKSYPHKSMRGCQVGYRNKTNAYSAWDKETYRQYLIDLALFGANSVEFMPGRTDDALSSPVMKYSSQEMLCYTSEIAHELGLKVWIWYPNLFVNETGIDIPSVGYVQENCPQARELNELLREEDEQRELDFSTVPYVDHIMIPGGDPGKLEPGDLFAYSARVAAILKKHHPHAGVWISAQVMRSDEAFKLRFYDEVVKKPAWLSGICHAPWVSHTMSECRERTPLELPIRNYPDICHMLCSQYPVHDMDPIWAVTAGRECYNPRPRWHKRMHNLNASLNIGSVAYSEGIADDVAKFIWLDQDWDVSISAQKTLRDYASMFISPDHADEFASVLFAFEEVFDGPATSNAVVPAVYDNLKKLEIKLASEKSMQNFGADSYRFLMARFMSAFYLHIQKRALRDTQAMSAAMTEISKGGTPADIAERMRDTLKCVHTSPDPELYDEIWALADTCYEKINWKLSTTRHFSPNYTRGGFLDTIDTPLCNYYWLMSWLDKLPDQKSDEERFELLQRLANRRNAGPGGKYISLGEPWAKKYLRLEKSWWDEPEAITIPRIEHHVGIWNPHAFGKAGTLHENILLERVSSALGYYKADVVLDIDGLVPHAAYELRIVFPLRFHWEGQLDIPAIITVDGERLELKGTLPYDQWVYLYDIPKGLVSAEGALSLTIGKEEGPRGSGATEVWLIQKQ